MLIHPRPSVPIWGECSGVIQTILVECDYCAASNINITAYVLQTVLGRRNMENSVFFCLCIHLLCVIFTHGKTLQTKDQQFVDSLQQYEFIELSLSEPLKDELDANDIPVEEKKTLSFRFQGQIIKLLLTLNRNLFSPNFFERHITKDGYEIVNKVPRNCYFHGHVEGQKDTTIVALSTCSGIEGYFTLNEKTFSIHPVVSLNGERLHIVFESDDLELPKYTCDHHRENATRETGERNILKERHRVRRDVFSETKYVELVIVNDFSQYQKRGSETSTRAIQMTNWADLIYRVQNIRVVLIMIEIWKVADKIKHSTDNDKFLSNFVSYKIKVLDKNESTQSDHAILVTQKVLKDNRSGWASLQTICTPRSASLLYDEYETLSLSGSIVAHELGHSFGFEHISSNCSCGEKQRNKCLMNTHLTHSPLKWSNCTAAKLNDVLERNHGTCLFNLPTGTYITPKCQNGFVESEEECDCGTKEECEKRPYNCCNYTTCKLHPGNECDGGMCCENCTIKAKGSLCRDRVNDCDLPEHCSGKSTNCPPNIYVHNGRSCRDGNDTSLCYFGVCHTHDKQCEAYWGPDGFFSERCHSKINAARNDFKYGYCKRLGEDKYMKCAKKDVLCGKLQCEMKKEISDRTPLNGDEAFHITKKAWTYKCWSGKLNLHVPHIGMVETGTMCGENKVCFNNTCLDINEAYGQPECPNNCSGNGICNNLGHCHCNPGYGCTNCSEKCDNNGGSVDSGNDCYCPTVSTTTASTVSTQQSTVITEETSTSEQSTPSTTGEIITTPAGNETGPTSPSQTTRKTTTEELKERTPLTTKPKGGNDTKVSETKETKIVPAVTGGSFAFIILLIIFFCRKQIVDQYHNFKFQKSQTSNYNPGDPQVIFSKYEAGVGESTPPVSVQFPRRNMIEPEKKSGDKNTEFTSVSFMPESKIDSLQNDGFS